MSKQATITEGDRIKALAKHLGEEAEGMAPASYDEKRIEVGKREYLVVTDEEADELWDEALDSYLDDCILCELKGPLANYFDREKWKSDARNDGRAHAINGYDGNEDEVEVETEDGEKVTLYVYRQN